MSARRAAIALCVLALAGCDQLLGLQDITPDGEPVALSLSAPTGSLARQPLDVITVDVVDVLGKPVPGFTGEVKLALGNNPGGATLLGTATATANAGSASFEAVGIDKPGAGYTLVASAEGLPPATSGPIAVVEPRFTPVVTGLAGGPIASVAVSPAPAGGTTTVFAGANDGVYKSVDRAASWGPATFGAGVEGVLVADPSRPGVVYFRNIYGSRLRKTVDGGVTWHALEPEHVSALALDPKNSSVVYVIAGAVLRRSSDGGTTWTDPGFEGCRDIAVDAVTPDTLYCSKYNSTTGQSVGVYKSSDGGGTWQPVNSGLSAPFDIRALVATPQGVFIYNYNYNNGVEGMLYRSSDAGDSWTPLFPDYTNAIAHAPSMPNRVYLARGGISVSNDGGRSFGPAVNAGDAITGLAVDPTNPDLVYAAARSGVLVSSNGGVSWSPASKGIDAFPITSVAMAPAAPDTVLTTTSAAVLRTINGGTSWAAASQPEVTVHFDPVVSTRVYRCGYSYFATSINSGASFTGGAVTGLNSYCDRLLIAGTTFFVAGGGTLFKSTDSGATWAQIGVGAASVYDATLGDLTGNVVVVSTQGGIFRSTNGGASFTQVTSREADYYAHPIASDPKLPTRIVFGECPGFRLSTDGGASFGSVTNGPCVQRVTGTGSGLYAAGYPMTGLVNGSVLLRSTDGGSSWGPIETTGLPSPNLISSVAASDDGATLYLGTRAGLYKAAAR